MGKDVKKVCPLCHEVNIFPERWDESNGEKIYFCHKCNRKIPDEEDKDETVVK